MKQRDQRIVFLDYRIARLENDGQYFGSVDFRKDSIIYGALVRGGMK